jgi:hypothetical protein
MVLFGVRRFPTHLFRFFGTILMRTDRGTCTTTKEIEWTS